MDFLFQDSESEYIILAYIYQEKTKQHLRVNYISKADVIAKYIPIWNN